MITPRLHDDAADDGNGDVKSSDGISSSVDMISMRATAPIYHHHSFTTAPLSNDTYAIT